MAIQERPIAPEDLGTDRRIGIAAMVFFFALIGIPMLIQPVAEISAGTPLQELDIFRQLPTVETIKRYEDGIVEASVVARAARPYVQLAQISLLDQGNEKGMVGRDGWMFFRPDVYFVTGFPLRSVYVKNDAKVAAWDPMPAIQDFHRQLSARGVELAVVPIPVKSQIYPEKLVGSYDEAAGPPANVVAEDFYYELRDAGVTVLDISRALWEAKGAGELYLKLDTHWTPLGMKTAARELAALLKLRYPALFAELGPGGVGFQTRPQTVTRHGDIFYQLNLPEGTGRYPPQEVAIEQVLDPATNAPVERGNADSPIVLLGDSFTNIFSTQEPNARGMQWGEGAGFGEHLMRELDRRIQVIAVNGGAPTATRKQLARRGGVAGKRLVVWSFATRELITPDTVWETVEVGATAQAAAAGPMTVLARVAVASKPPRPRVDPYSEAVTMTLYDVVKVEKGSFAPTSLLAVEWVMRDFKLLKAAQYRPGELHRLNLVPYAAKEGEDPSIAQVKQLDNTGDLSAPFWVESAEAVE